MTGSAEDVERFRERIETEYGLIFDEGRKEQVQEAFVARCAELGLEAKDYLDHLSENKGEWHAVAALLTVPESYFFRHSDHLRAFREVAVPERMATHPADQTLRVLCIGCANGEEPYTLSMLLGEQLGTSQGWKFHIRGCDINPEALRRAERGVYTNWALRATPPIYRSRYFTATANRFRVVDSVRQPVRFDRCNVLNLCRSEGAQNLDVVFFRNVLIYFSPEAIRAAVNAVAHLLAPGGYLFLGPAETLRGVSNDFTLCHTHETFYYRRNESIGDLIPFGPLTHKESPFSSSTGLPQNSGDDPDVPMRAFWSAPSELPGTEWLDEIDRSSERIKGLDRGRRLRPAKSGAAEPVEQGSREKRALTSGEEVQRATALFRAELYGEFLESLKGISSEAASDPDLQLFRAVAHLNRREIEEAERVCRSLVERDSMNASGHYVLALCREHARDLSGSADHDRIAIYLDTTFAMPHMHLAIIARRRGDKHTARRQFEQAILLLARESESRLLMFGGGFSREALRKLCRRELQAIGGAS